MHTMELVDILVTLRCVTVSKLVKKYSSDPATPTEVYEIIC